MIRDAQIVHANYYIHASHQGQTSRAGQGSIKWILENLVPLPANIFSKPPYPATCSSTSDLPAHQASLPGLDFEAPALQNIQSSRDCSFPHGPAMHACVGHILQDQHIRLSGRQPMLHITLFTTIKVRSADLATRVSSESKILPTTPDILRTAVLVVNVKHQPLRQLHRTSSWQLRNPDQRHAQCARFFVPAITGKIETRSNAPRRDISPAPAQSCPNRKQRLSVILGSCRAILANEVIRKTCSRQDIKVFSQTRIKIGHV